MTLSLPPGVTVLERGWLSSNNVVLVGRASTAVVDTGYATHAAQTLSLVDVALSGRPLDHIVCTHLHSDHCGGNAALQSAYPGVRTRIPPGQFDAVRKWDDARLSYQPTGQICPRFHADGCVAPGDTLEMAERSWQVHAAPGHDPHSVLLFEPDSRCLISTDALWRKGFGIVFPELEGESGFDEVAATLDCIEALHPETVIPGHGSPFHGELEVADSLQAARSRLEAFSRAPQRHAAYAIKALLKFKLLEWQAVAEEGFIGWAEHTPYLAATHQRYFADWPLRPWLRHLIDQLVSSGAMAREGALLFNR